MGTFSNYRTNVPQVRLDVDRDKAKLLGLRISDIFQALQIYLGGYQVNDFNLFGKTYKVMIQADQQYRASPDQILNLYAGTASGSMVPLSAVAKIGKKTGPDVIQRYNMFRTAEIGGSNAMNYSTGQTIQALESVARETLPAGYGFEWTGTAYQEKIAGSSQTLILLMGVGFVFLLLAAQYESWTIPFSVLLGLPIGIFGAFLALGFRLLVQHIPTVNDVYAQIGIVMLIGLAAKNAILIVEFARMKQEGQGVPIREAALAGARPRFRPILMTSAAFILGVLPLVTASGAGAGGTAHHGDRGIWRHAGSHSPRRLYYSRALRHSGTCGREHWAQENVRATSKFGASRRYRLKLLTISLFVACCFLGKSKRAPKWRCLPP